MKKFLAVFILVFLTFLVPCTVYVNAGQIAPSVSESSVPKTVKLEITSGLDVSKDSESTFDSSRTIVGSSYEGADVLIILYLRNSDNELVEKSRYSVSVGALGIFSQSVNLNIGENVITVIADLEDYDSNSSSFVVKRKNREIKKVLESTITLPELR